MRGVPDGFCIRSPGGMLARKSACLAAQKSTWQRRRDGGLTDPPRKFKYENALNSDFRVGHNSSK